MGMDVYGKNPTSEKGEYFRNNVWYWRPLWQYCVAVAPELCETVDGDTNGGDGLDEAGALELAKRLRDELESGATAENERQYNEWRASLPWDDCSLCGATGIRTDAVGVEMGMPEKELSPEEAMFAGRSHGWCNGCRGYGKTESWQTNYPFSVENVREFVEFLQDSGGFSIC